jgi:hypothetical protein
MIRNRCDDSRNYFVLMKLIAINLIMQLITILVGNVIIGRGMLSRWVVVDQVTAILALVQRASQHRCASLKSK